MKILLVLTFALLHFASSEDNITSIFYDGHHHYSSRFCDDCPTSSAYATSSYGTPIHSLTSSLTVGRCGPCVLSDTHLIEELAHCNRERIPERLSHANGCGACGYFLCTEDITQYCCASVFEPGACTKVHARYSTTDRGLGSPDNTHDNRGAAFKHYTKCGNFDMTCLNFPCFACSDAKLFVSLVHSRKTNPKTNLPDPCAFWDFICCRPETLMQCVMLHSSKGFPYSFDRCDYYGCNTYTLRNANGDKCYAKFTYECREGMDNRTAAWCQKKCGEDPDFGKRVLCNRIEAGDYPKWDLFIQVMSCEEAKNCGFNPFDATKFWFEEDWPFIPVGYLCLDQIPCNHFTYTEQAAFCPSNLIPGIEPSPDRLLQGRMFCYPDAQRYRLGVNYPQLEVNRPLEKPRNYERDGASCYEKYCGPNYYPNTCSGPGVKPGQFKCPESICGDLDYYDYEQGHDYYSQVARWYWLWTDGERETICMNIADSLSQVTCPTITARAIEHFRCVDTGLADGILRHMYYNK